MAVTRVSDQADRVRSILSDHMPWSPMGFIREVDGAGDRRLRAQHLTRPVDEADDMRFVSQLDSGDEVAVITERLPWDSEFFGYGVGRIDGVFPLTSPWYSPDADYRGVVDRVKADARSGGIKYLFATIDPRDVATLRALGAHGFSLIETRVLYHLNLRNYSYPERYAVRVATADDINALARTAREMVNPFDRFHADPFIDPASADRLMEQWIYASIVEGFADMTMVPDCAEPTAFSTVRYHQREWDLWRLRLAQIVLSGVGPEFRGWHRKIVSEINYHLRDNVGADHIYITTQLSNTRVTWVLESLGFRLGRGEHVLRLIL